MIERLKLENFQSHELLEIVFDENITTITGRTDVGKSAVVRSIGAALLNHVNNGHIRNGSKQTEVTVCVDGKTIRRVKGSNKNEYHLDETEYKAFGKSVPEPIATHLNVDPDSVQRQFDAPFWVGLSGGALADELNRITGVELLSEMGRTSLANLKSAKVEVDKATGGVRAIESELDSLAWVTDDLVADCRRSEIGRGKLNESSKQIGDLERAIDACREWLTPERAAEICSTREAIEAAYEKLDTLLERQRTLTRVDASIRVIMETTDEIKKIKNEQTQLAEKLDRSEFRCPTCNQPVDMKNNVPQR